MRKRKNTTSYNFTLIGEPKPKKRPKVYRWSTINPSKADEAAIKYQIQHPLKFHISQHVFPLKGQLVVTLKFYKTPPKATPKWKLPLMNAGTIRPNKSPDLDNYIKLILDALNGIIWDDDRYIVEINASKFYTTDTPRTEVKVYILPTPTRINAF